MSQNLSTSEDDAPRYRSGAVARMVQMPVATLRVWERRYALTATNSTTSSQRLYSANEVRRIALLKQLTELGHAIGSLAALDSAQLQAIKVTHASSLAQAQTGVHQRAAEPASAQAAQPVRVVVVGAALASRLSRADVVRQMSRPFEVIGAFDSIEQATAAPGIDAAQALLLQLSSLHPAWLAQARAAAPALFALPIGVLYSFASQAVVRQLTNEGLFLLRETHADAALGRWLHRVSAAARGATPRLAGVASSAPPLPARRWDDASLADIAALTSTVACECPRHISELLTLLTHFEAYSADCEQLSPEDTELHVYLRHVAATSRAQFETALQRVAEHEGLILPP